MRPVISFEKFYESIWLKIPEVWRNADADSGRPLQVLTLTLAQHFYYSFYLKIAAMDELFDPDLCPEKYLPFLAATINWKLIGTDSKSWRNQIRSAPLLYKIKGTRKSLTLAEKLIGYSVFMTELYRDSTGKIVPKEKLFNSFPVSTKIKPWFRKKSTDISDSIFNDLFSDQLPSYNENFGTLNSLGELLVSKPLRKTGSRSLPVSSLPNYNPITGEGSLARLAKTSRITVILKKDLEIDYTNSDGKITDIVLQEAIDLFLRFKPFHVYIQDLCVLYDASDYLCGDSVVSDVTTEGVSGDSILNHEFTDIYVEVQNDDRISYFNQEELGSCDSDILDTSDNLQFKGLLDTKYKHIDCSIYTVEKDREYLLSLGLQVTNLGYATNLQTDNGKTIWYADDFTVYSIDDQLVSLDTKTKTVLSDSVMPYQDELTQKFYAFAKYPLELPYLSHFFSLFYEEALTDYASNITDWIRDIATVSVNKSEYYKDTIVGPKNTYSYLSEKPVPISLKGIECIRSIITMNAIKDPILNYNTQIIPSTLPDFTQHYIDEITALTRILFQQPIIIIFKYNNPSDGIAHDLLLTPKLHYAYDYKTSSLILNEYAITKTLFELDYSEDVLQHGHIHIVYSALVPTSQDFSITSGARKNQLSVTRTFLPFNRTTYADNSGIQTKIDTVHYEPALEFSDTTGTLVENTAKTKLFKESLPRIFTRNSLHLEDTGTSYAAITYDKKSPIDKSKWKVYIDPAEQLYHGPERICKTIWANYFNVPFTDTALIDYTSIDTSFEAQIQNRSSYRWLATLDSLSETNPAYFLASRKNVGSRNAIWTRGSASKMPIPYIGSSRKFIQGFRTFTLFNRTENLPDYSISLLVNYTTDKYKYTLNNIDYTDIYRNPTIPFEELPIPQTELYAVKKTTVINETISYPSYAANYVTQYEEPFNSCDRSTYYIDGTLKPSFYANNIRTDMCPYSDLLLSEAADPIDFDIDGLEQIVDTFIISDVTISELVLSKTNLFVSWREFNSGLSLGTGLFPLVKYFSVRPNIVVLRNGIEIVYGDYWTIASHPNRILISPNLKISLNDTFSIKYYTLDGLTLPVVPTDPDTGIVYDSGNTTTYTQTVNINSTPNTEVLYEIALTHNAVVSWYRSDTSQYISTSVDKGLNTVPIPEMYKDLAVPTTQVRRNSILLPYGSLWDFIAIPGTQSYRIRLSEQVTQALQIGDTLTVSYVGLL